MLDGGGGEGGDGRRTLRSQLALRRRLEGLRSRWRTFAECNAFKARRALQFKTQHQNQGRDQPIPIPIHPPPTPTTHLINKILTMIITQLLGPNHPMHIRLHQLLHQINLFETLQAPRPGDIEDIDDVLVLEVAEELDLAESAEAEHGVVEWGDFLDGDAVLGGEVDG